MSKQGEIREGIARRLYERTSHQLLLANYFGSKPTYDIKWDALSDDAKITWLKGASDEMVELDSQGVVIARCGFYSDVMERLIDQRKAGS